MAYYYINKIPNNINHYQYFYLDHIESIIVFKDNYWDFHIDLFTINDLLLPPNVLIGNLRLPYQEINEITFNLASDQTRATAIETYQYAKYCHIYQTDLEINIAANEFFKQEINNAKLNCLLNLQLDAQPLKNTGINFDQQAIDRLTIEIQEQKWDIEMYYSNSYLIERNGTISNIYGYQLAKDHKCLDKFNILNISCDDYSDNVAPIINLARIESMNPFQILSAEAKFVYSKKLEYNPKTYTTNLLIDRAYKNKLDISFISPTIYDYDNEQTTYDPYGLIGFYLPIDAEGYYELHLQLKQESNTVKIIIKNPFKFNNSSIKPHIIVSHILIDDLKDFKEVKLND